MSVKYFGSDALNKLIDLVKTALGLKADNVSGATADDIATLTSVGNLKDSGISSLKVVDTGFVASAEIKNNVSANALGLDVKIEPNQDLHGYDYPWVGGTGKNLFPNPTAGTQSSSGITLSVDSNGVFTINGTATADVELLFNIPTFVVPTSIGQGGNGCFYIFNDFTSSNTYLQFYNGSTNVDYWSFSEIGKKNSTYSVMSGKTITRVGIRIVSGQTFTNAKFSPMFTNDGTTDATFEPYANICPIYGRSQTSLTFIGDQGGTTGTYQMGGVYYGGVYDVTTGELIIDRAYVEFDGSDDEGWNATNGTNCETALFASIIKKTSNNQVANIKCNRLKPETANHTYTGTIGIAVGNDGYIGVSYDGTKHTTAEYKTWLSNNPLQVVYELAEPITYTIAAKTVMLPLGNSTGTASTGDIRVKYEKKFTDYYDDEIADIWARINALEEV